MSQAVIKAYAKINLVLDVLKKRADGYHEVEMIMQAISLYDRITIKPAPGIIIQTNHPSVPEDNRNLAYKAAQLLKDKYPDLPGVEIIIDKKIPVEAGLAGGSTDGAAVILGMNGLFSLKMSKADMLDLAAQLGSDVPFCILGPTALAAGRGELVEEISPCPLLWFVLVKPEFGVKTPEVYKNLKLAEIEAHPNIARYKEAIFNREKKYISNNMANVLELSTFNLYPEVKEIKNKIYQLGGKNVLMSGSGPTVFAVFESEQEALDLSKELEKIYSQVYIAHTVSEEEIKERVVIYE